MCSTILKGTFFCQRLFIFLFLLKLWNSSDFISSPNNYLSSVNPYFLAIPHLYSLLMTYLWKCLRGVLNSLAIYMRPIYFFILYLFILRFNCVYVSSVFTVFTRHSAFIRDIYMRPIYFFFLYLFILRFNCVYVSSVLIAYVRRICSL